MVSYESSIQVHSIDGIVNRNQLSNQALQRFSATPSETLNRAIRNLSGYFQRTLTQRIEAYCDDLEYHRRDCRKTSLLRFYLQKTRFWACPRHDLLHVTPKQQQLSTIRPIDRLHRLSASVIHCYRCETVSARIADGNCSKKSAQNCNCAAFTVPCTGLAQE